MMIADILYLIALVISIGVGGLQFQIISRQKDLIDELLVELNTANKDLARGVRERAVSLLMEIDSRGSA